MEIIPQILAALAWPVAVFGVAFMFRKEIRELFSHIKEVEAKGIKLIVERLEKKRDHFPFRHAKSCPAYPPMIFGHLTLLRT
jgi:hypothetical protein